MMGIREDAIYYEFETEEEAKKILEMVEKLLNQIEDLYKSIFEYKIYICKEDIIDYISKRKELCDIFLKYSNAKNVKELRKLTLNKLKRKVFSLTHFLTYIKQTCEIFLGSYG